MYSEIEKTKDLFLFFFRNMQNRENATCFEDFYKKRTQACVLGGKKTEFFRAPILNLESYVVFVHSPKLKTKAGGKSSLPGSYCNRAPASAFLTR